MQDTRAEAITAARKALLRRLDAEGYRFTTPAPATHQRILLRRGRVAARTLEDIFGWNLGFAPDGPFAGLADALERADMLRQQGRQLFSTLRVATCAELLFLHSGFPADGEDAVFFGPDSYRFAAFIQAHAPDLPPGASIVDIGCGSGVGGIVAHHLRPEASLTLADVNPAALQLAAVNAACAGQSPQLIRCEGAPTTGPAPHLVVANPPYLGGSGKVYSDGGGPLGAQVSLDWTRQALAALAPGGRYLLYTGSAIVGGEDALEAELRRLCDRSGCTMRYEELDPDVFPSTLLQRAYWKVERIAAIGAVIDKPAEAAGRLRAER